MTITLNASTASGLVVTPDNSGVVAIQNNGTTGFTLDASGRPLTPLRPSFYAQLTSGNTGTSGTIIYNNVVLNIGSCYSASTGIFTAPVSGVYQFNITAISAAGGYVETAIYYNGLSTMVFNIRGSGGSPTTAGAGGSFTYFMNATDTMRCAIAGSASQYGFGPYTTFSGFLVG